MQTHQPSSSMPGPKVSLSSWAKHFLPPAAREPSFPSLQLLSAFHSRETSPNSDQKKDHRRGPFTEKAPAQQCLSLSSVK